MKKLHYHRVSISLIILVALLTFISVSGAYFIQKLHAGVGGMQKRLSADLMIVPADHTQDAESILLEGTREYFYFDKAISGQVKDLEGVEQLTEQFYLASLNADCCSLPVGIVGYDEQTDFIVTPWIQDRINESEILVGSKIDLEDDEKGTIKLFGREYSVGARLAETGTSLDQSVYVPFSYIPELIEDAEAKGLHFLDRQKKENVISSVFVKLSDESKSNRIEKSLQTAEVEVVYPNELLKQYVVDTSQMLHIANLILVIFYLILNGIVILSGFLSAEKRKKEYAILRILGVPRAQLFLDQIWFDIKMIGVGYALGLVGVGIFVIPFGRYIAKQFDIAYVPLNAQEGILIIGVTLVTIFITMVISSILPLIPLIRMDKYMALRSEEV